MQSNFKMVRKNLAELSEDEIAVLSKTCKKGGAFGTILKALRNGKVQEPEKLYISILCSDDIIMGWLFVDPVREYNELAGNDEVSVMIFVSPNYRGKKVASKLMLEEKENLQGKKLLCYPSKKNKPFFYKMGKAFGLNFTAKEPVLYFKR